MTQVTDEAQDSEYLGSSFEDWHVAAAKYAEEHLDLWPFQVSEMASDWAWRWEGCKITSEILHEAYEDWISGFNPYCKPHNIALEGYDQMGEYDHKAIVACRDITDLAVSMGVERPVAETMAQDIRKHHGDSVGIYNKEKHFRKWIDEWFSGVNRYSPHRVPLDTVNLEERKARLKEESLRKKNKNSDKPDWETELFAPYMVDLS